MKYFQNSLGYGYQDEKVLIFFGNKAGELKALQEEFPTFKFLRVKQTHSDIFIPASENLKEADAHWTAEKNQALLIATADCMPLMIFCEQTHRVTALHAGWRGVANGIIEKTLNQLIYSGSDAKQFKIFCGPSIQQQSFEVDQDVFEKILQRSRMPKPQEYSFSKETKHYVNLNLSAQKQILYAAGVFNCVFSTVDTKTDENYFSYRRGKLSSERNLSFICLLT